jgi:outer membrane protein
MKLDALAILGTIFASVLASSAQRAQCETLSDALGRAYSNNPGINQQRFSVRADDEGVVKAWTGLRPSAVIYGNAGPQRTDLHGNVRLLPVINERVPFTADNNAVPRGVSFNLSQTIFDGGRTENNVLRAEAAMFSARAGLRGAEQNLLQNTATAYMDVLRDTAILSLRKNNIEVLTVQLRNTRDNLAAGYLTETDVAQAESALSHARSEYYGSESQLKKSAANYRRLVGDEPRKLQPTGSVERYLPRNLDEAITLAIANHPGLEAAHHQLTAAEYGVKAAEADLMPSLSVQGQVLQQYDFFFGLQGWRQTVAGVNLNLRVPIYQGGGDYASIRIAKEQVGQARFGADAQRDDIRAAVVSAYASLTAAKQQMVADRATVRSAELALRGVREESKSGLRTTLDVLNSQQSLLAARVNLVISQHDVVVASYAALAAVGGLSVDALGLDVQRYDPVPHYNAVKDKYFGLDTP